MEFKATIMESGKFKMDSNTTFTLYKKDLKEAIKNTNTPLFLTYDFDKNKVIGSINDLKYKDGTIIANVNLLKNVYIVNKSIRCTYNINDMEIIGCGLIENNLVLKRLKDK